ncbi:MAG: hypothetical protein AAGI38_24655 [Bacteroidota bacterium]
MLLISSCAMTKEGKRIKRGSKVLRDSQVLLYASWEGTVGHLNLAIRTNNFFTMNEFAFFVWEFYAGTWTRSNDTIHLNYIDGHKRSDLLDYVLVDEKEIRLTRIDSLPPIRLMIKYRKLE